MCRRIGDSSVEVTPVPIPNTVVKLFSPDDTMWATAWENKTSPIRPPTQASLCGSGSVVEHFLAKEDVAGSNPVSRSRRHLLRWRLFLWPSHEILNSRTCGYEAR